MSDPALELAKNRAWPALQRVNLRLESGDMTEQEWYEEVAAGIVPAYLAGRNPRAQSGSDGSVQDWTYKCAPSPKQREEFGPIVTEDARRIVAMGHDRIAERYAQRS